MPKPKFTRQHHNGIAKSIREEFAFFMITGNDDASKVARGAIANIALNIAKRFADDNDFFDPVEFLNQCSPNEDIYPLGELWGYGRIERS